MTFCGNCGSDNPAENRFCFNCGATLPPAPEEPQMGYKPPVNEVERIGPYNPNANYYQAPPVQQQFQQPPYGQPYQQQQFEQPAQQYQQQPYDQTYQQQQQFQQPAQQYQQPPYDPAYQQQQYAPAPMQPYQQPPYGQPYPQQSMRGPIFLQGSPNNNANLRFVGMALSIAAFALTIVALVAINVIDDMSLLSFGLSKGGEMMILVFSIVSIVVGVASVLVPMFTVVSGVCVIMTASLLKISKNLSELVSGSGFTTVIILAVAVMILGLAASFVMSKYVRSNVRNVTMFQCNLFTWTGIRVPQGNQPQAPYQRPPYY